MIGLHLDAMEKMDLIRDAAQDEGDRNMRRGNREKWNQDDFNAAAREFDRLCPATTEEDTTP